MITSVTDDGEDPGGEGLPPLRSLRFLLFKSVSFPAPFVEVDTEAYVQNLLSVFRISAFPPASAFRFSSNQPLNIPARLAILAQ